MATTVSPPVPTATGPAGAVDARALARELAQQVRGEVRFSAGSRALYANDSSVYRQVPIGVVIPRTVDDVVATVAACRRHHAPIGARGCGTGLAGQTVNEAVMIDFSKYLDGLLELDPEGRRARVQPGIVLDRLREAAEEHELTFGPDPATHSRCTLGGMIGNNSCGTHSIMAGVTADNVEALDVLLYDGTRMRLPSRVTDEDLATTVAAALVEVEPGALRELHWHPNADEWQYYLAGSGRMTVFAAEAKARTFDYGAGDVGYVPFAMGHHIQNTGDTTLRFLELFRSDRFADVSLQQWLALTPRALVRQHLNVGAGVLDALCARERPVVR
jgi:oxalate decarboxylase/phosphoglucose isomerase-like protein (cupin superfamily)